MKAEIGHIGINLPDAGPAFTFWKDLLVHLGFTLMEEDRHFDASDGRTYLCVQVTAEEHAAAGFHRRRTGLNHLAFRVPAPGDVDRFVEDFLVPRHIPVLYGGPRDFPEYLPGYRAVYFEDPGRIKIEVVYEPSGAPGC